MDLGKGPLVFSLPRSLFSPSTMSISRSSMTRQFSFTSVVTGIETGCESVKVEIRLKWPFVYGPPSYQSLRRPVLSRRPEPNEWALVFSNLNFETGSRKDETVVHLTSFCREGTEGLKTSFSGSLSLVPYLTVISGLFREKIQR